MELRGDWNYPTRIRFGAGRIRELADVCGSLGIRRPLLVTDPGLVKLPVISAAVGNCEEAGLVCAVFDEIQPHPTAENVHCGVNAFRKGAHDGIVAIGGGTALDVGKAIGLMARESRPLSDFEDHPVPPARANAVGTAPIIAVPTTAGTGSEVACDALLVEPAQRVKKVIADPGMMPATVIADPELSVRVPADVTAATGMDALSHALEAYCSPVFHPLAEGVAVEAVRIIREWLPRAVRESHDITARAHMLAASTMGAAAFQKGLGAMHSLSHPCSARLNVHHGLVKAVVMPYVLRWNREAISEKMTRLAAWLGLQETSVEGVLAWILELREQTGLPHTLAELGVRKEHARELAPLAFADPATRTNPVPLTIRDFEQLCICCIDGDLDGCPA